MHKLTTHLWYDKEAREAAALYTSVFKDSKVLGTTVLSDTPSGTVDVVDIEISGQKFTLLSAGPYFKFNPSISFLVACETKEEVDEIWSKLSPGGFALMELGSYPFSDRYGWTTDKFGLSWQIMYAGEWKFKQKITPTLMFVKEKAGKAEEAMSFYTSVFHDSKIGSIMRWGAGEDPEKEGTVKHAGFTLEGMEFSAMDSANKHEFDFNEAISFMVHCEDQTEIDYYWEKLSADPKAEQCGWLKDKYGVSWQVVPNAMDKMMSTGNKEQLARVTQAFLKMKKFDIAELEKAYEG
jgi:predicted 3-demethylubiquinone-9 3-methyltransferase (glyoxalase superfamily)